MEGGNVDSEKDTQCIDICPDFSLSFIQEYLPVWEEGDLCTSGKENMFSSKTKATVCVWFRVIQKQGEFFCFGSVEHMVLLMRTPTNVCMPWVLDNISDLNSLFVLFYSFSSPDCLLSSSLENFSSQYQ